MNILLLVVGIIFVGSVIVGYKKGFVKIVASLLATLISMVLVMVLMPHVSTWIQNSTPLKTTIQEKCIEALQLDGGPSVSLSDIEIPREHQISLIEGANLPSIFQDMLLENNNNEVYANLGVSTFGEYVGAYIAKVVADIIAFLVTFILVMIIVRIGLNLLGIVNKIPLIGGANRLVGAILGGGIGILIIWVLFIVITLLYSTSLGAACMESISGNAILSKLYDSNLLMNAITKF